MEGGWRLRPSVYLNGRQPIAMGSLDLTVGCTILGRMWAPGVSQWYSTAGPGTVHPLPGPHPRSITQRKPSLGRRRIVKSSKDFEAALFLVVSRIRQNPTISNHSPVTTKKKRELGQPCPRVERNLWDRTLFRDTLIVHSKQCKCS